jgi:thymidine kinase
MAKLYFHYSTMNAGKSTILLQSAHNYQERGMKPLLLTAKLDNRAGLGKIVSRIGISESAEVFSTGENLYSKISVEHSKKKIHCVFVDEAQFLSEAQVWELTKVVDVLKIPVMCYGLRVDFRGKLFPGSLNLLALADEMREIKTICHCGKKATMVVRQNESGEAILEGQQVQIGGNETYTSLCRIHWKKIFHSINI